MRIKDNLVLKEIAGAYVVLPIGTATVDFTGILTLNESGAMLWRLINDGYDSEQLTEALVNEYEVSMEQARLDVDEFIDKLNSANCLDI